MKDNMKIVIFGSGVVGQTIGGWLAPHHDNLYFLDQGETAKTLKEQGITLYQQGEEDKKTQVNVKVIDDIKQAKDADVIAVGVKNYSLDAVSKVIKDAVGDKAVIIGMQNGVINQKILPKYFSKVIFCVVGYNGWFDKPGIVGYQKKGPLVLGTLKNDLREEMEQVTAVLNKGVETVVVDHLQDAAYSKLIINLTNSLTTIIGHGFKPVSDQGLFQKLLSNLLLEGVNIVKAVGYNECKIGGMPPWAKIWMGAKLPQFITRGMFNKNAKKMVVSSMAQDIIQRGGHDSELETINGHLLELADQHNIQAPYIRTMYEMCKREFAKDTFTPLDVAEVWGEVSEAL